VKVKPATREEGLEALLNFALFLVT